MHYLLQNAARFKCFCIASANLIPVVTVICAHAHCTDIYPHERAEAF